MKIKCPVCSEFEDDNEINIRDHLLKHPVASVIYYKNLLFKIHEKYESIAKETPSKCKTFNDAIKFQRNMGALQELKSLLENEI